MRTEDPGYKLYVKVDDAKDVPCEVFLPAKSTDNVVLHFYPEPNTPPSPFPWRFSICGEIRSFDGVIQTLLEAKTVYRRQEKTRHWAHNVVQRTVVGEPIDLKITDFIHREPSANRENRLRGCYWISPCQMLLRPKFITRSYTGAITVSSGKPKRVLLANGIKVRFDQRFRHRDDPNGGMVALEEQVAEFDVDASFDKRVEDLAVIDDFLMLVSFAARQRCVCAGWRIARDDRVTTLYRRDVTIPAVKQGYSFDDALVDFAHTKEFIKQTYRRYLRIDEPERGLLRRAIHGAIGQEKHTLESSWLTLFSALESALRFYQTVSPSSGGVLKPADWKSLSSRLDACVSDFAESRKKKSKVLWKSRIDQMRKNLGSLNRPPLSSAFDQMCKHYRIDLNDLWPISRGGKGQSSLYGIRNKLVHGQVFPYAQQGVALIGAREHLRWTLERVLLSILGWPVEQSRVSPRFLAARMACYKDWQADRDILSKE